MSIGTLQLFTGTKTLKATPLNLGAYNILRGWTLPADEDPKAEGYLVEYQDGGKANLPDFAGYVSWSPKDVFEKTYRLCETFEQRIINETADLKSNLDKLESFIVSDKFLRIEREQQRLLWQQQSAMAMYLGVLELRLKALNK